MNELISSEAFITGVSVGISLYQNKVVTAHEQKQPIKIGQELYYIQSGQEGLQQMLNEICK